MAARSPAREHFERTNRPPEIPAGQNIVPTLSNPEGITAAIVAAGGNVRPQFDPRIIAHRHGGALCWPENSLSGARAALRAGVTKIETDVHLTADGVPVIMHDDTVDRTTNGTGAVSGFTLAQWQELRLDPGTWLAPGYPSEPVPTLDDLLDLLEPYPDVVLVLEIKTLAAANAAVAAVLARGWARERVWVSSFIQAALQPGIYAGFPAQIFLDATDSTNWAGLFAAGVTIAGMNGGTSTAPRVAAAHAAGLLVNVWTLVRRVDVDWLFANVFPDFVTSDDPIWNARANVVLPRDPFAFPQCIPGMTTPRLVDRSFSDGGLRVNNDAATPNQVLQGWADFIDADTYSIELEFKINEMSDLSRHFDVSFCCPTDKRVDDATTDDLHYNLIARGNGDFGIWRVGAGVAANVLIGSQQPALGTGWHAIRIDVTPGSISASLDGGEPIVTNNTQIPRRGYFYIGPSGKGSGASVSASFRNVRIA
jgi:glycerophosphoryl diester phosphodiesterase